MSPSPFDDLARSLAEPTSRRRALRIMGAAALAAAVPALRPAWARAVTGGATGPQRMSKCGESVECAAYNPRVVSGCCSVKDICCRFPDGFHCCDPKRHKCGNPNRPCICLRPCGDPRNCCYPDDECVDGKYCMDKCLPGSTRCGLDYQCCPPGGRCVADGCRCKDGRDFCGQACCKKDEECHGGRCKAVCATETDRRATRLYDRKTHCCTESGIEPKYPIRYFERCRKTRVAREGYKPTANGCGPKGGPKFPDTFGKASFLAACNAHDLCYSRCRSDRATCDERFRTRLTKACTAAYPGGGKQLKACLQRADEYHSGVVALGSVAYDDAQSEACQCCP